VNQRANGNNSRESDPANRLVRLAERSLPTRVRHLLEGLVARTSWFELALGSMFDDAAQGLFKQADRARNNEHQAQLMEAVREINRGKADVFPRFLVHVESSLALIDRPTIGMSHEQAARNPLSAPLELVDSGDLEIQLAMQDIANKAEMRHSPSLFLLGHRLGIIAGRPPLEADTMPLAPMAITNALHYALANFDLNVNQRIALFQAFERSVIAPIGTFYDVVNHYLIAQSVLPNLQFKLRRSGGEVSAAGRATGQPASAATKEEDASANPSAADVAQGNAPGAFAPPQGFGGQQAPQARYAANASPYGATTDHARHVEHGTSDMALFASLRSLLSERRRALGAPQSQPADAYQATRDDLQAVLGNLQRGVGKALLQSGTTPKGIGHLKQDLLNQLRATSPSGKTPLLAEEDSDTIDLVGMLFDYIGQNLSSQGPGRDLISKLQVPVLRSAIRDKNFFTQREHPARALLNSIAEASTTWLSDEEADRGLLDKMNSMVEHIARDFDGDVSLMETLLGDLNQYMAQITRRAEITERRHIDAAKGREKLELARQRANAAVARLLSRSKPAPMVRAVLEQAWADVLALTMLRQGEESQQYRRSLAVADQLLQIGKGTDVEKVDAKVREEVRNGLLQVGLHGEEADGVVEKLFDPTNVDAKSSATEVALTLKSKPRLGEDAVAPSTESAEPEVPVAPLNKEETEMLARLRTLPFGTWFEFVTNQQGSTVRRKLAWFSPVTGRCLFVNRRGARADERTMDQLARDLVRGQVRLADDNPEKFIDRAWKAIKEALQQLTGNSSATEPSPA
jgi:hypothetical protein